MIFYIVVTIIVWALSAYFWIEEKNSYFGPDKDSLKWLARVFFAAPLWPLMVLGVVGYLLYRMGKDALGIGLGEKNANN